MYALPFLLHAVATTLTMAVNAIIIAFSHFNVLDSQNVATIVRLSFGAIELMYKSLSCLF